MISLEGKRILVTGASSGIGKAIAEQAALLGASLILFGRNIQRLEETYAGLNGIGHEYYTVDVTNYNLMDELISSSVAKSGPISGFVHSAGVEKTLPFKLSKPIQFKEVFEINVFAGFEIARLISQKKIINPNGGSIVFISSVMGQTGESGKIIYCSSKSALLSGSKAIALELSSKKIRCNCILPGIVETEMVKNLFENISIEAKQKIIEKHPLGIGKPSDVASLTCFLLSDQAKWITGSDYVIDGGYSAQ
jgi:NAD(P)-dependent dehydrogenase (short-subunit alcohol dehydrogenase family)